MSEHPWRLLSHAINLYNLDSFYCTPGTIRAPRLHVPKPDEPTTLLLLHLLLQLITSSVPVPVWDDQEQVSLQAPSALDIQMRPQESLITLA